MWPWLERLAAAALAAGAGVDAELLCGSTLLSLSRGAEAEELLKSLTAHALPEPVWSTAVNLRADNLLWPLGQPEQSRTFIDGALAARPSQSLTGCWLSEQCSGRRSTTS